MEKFINMKALFQATCLTALFLGATSISSSLQAEAMHRSESDTTEVVKDTVVVIDDVSDAQFLTNAAQMSIEEISLAKLAQQKGTSLQVKALGKMLQEYHEQSIVDLTALANSKTIALETKPTDKGVEAYKLLDEKLVKDFDKAYADLMVSKHQDAITAFGTASTASKDADIRAWAATTLTGLQTHLEQALNCQKACEKSPVTDK